MKSFFASFFGALVALVVFVFGSMFLMFVFFALIAALGQKPQKPSFEKGSYLVFDLSTNITDAPSPYDESGKLAAFLGADGHRLQLRLAVEALRAAAKDERIAGLLLTGNLQPQDYGSGFAALREVRQAVTDFKASGKPVVAYTESMDRRDYFLMSAASEVVLHPFGLVWTPGLASESMFLAGTLEKLGIGVQVTRAGKYKSAVEPLVRHDFSPESREALQKLLDDLWGEIRAAAAESRKLSPEKLQALLDQPEAQRGEVAVKNGLIDRVAYWDEVLDDLKQRTHNDAGDRTFKQVDLRTYITAAKSVRRSTSVGDRVVVVYAEGEIVDGEGEDNGQVGGDRFAREIRRLREDHSVKAVVLRVNSPGGSANASEVIQRELRLLKEEKPLIVSMGTVAASGGYWISAYSDRIFAEPSTITGSIGVFGVLFNIRDLSTKIGLSFDVVKTAKFADLETISRPKNAEEMASIQSVVDWLYESFLDRVAEGRKLDRAVVAELAQGRVWSGVDAKRLGLVDEFGGLQAALDFAASKAKLGRSYRLEEYPGKRDLGEVFRELFEEKREYLSKASLSSKLVHRVEAEVKPLRQFNDPRGVYLRLPADLKIE